MDENEKVEGANLEMPAGQAAEVGQAQPADRDSSEGQEAPKAQKAPKATGVSRRGFMAGAAGAAALFVVGGLRFVGSVPMVRPPGGQDEANLLSKCIRCGRCIESCPQQVILPAHLESGIVSTRTPYMSYESNACTFCRDEEDSYPRCVKHCPTGALDITGFALPFQGNSKSSVINLVLGRANIDVYQCLAYRDTGCHYCADACPYGAIELVESTDNQLLKRPVVLDKMCNGCGMCESVCVSLTTGSIVEGSTRRAIAVQPIDQA